MITYLMNAINGTEMTVDAEGKLSPEALIQYGNEKFRVNSKEKVINIILVIFFLSNVVLMEKLKYLVFSVNLEISMFLQNMLKI